MDKKTITMIESSMALIGGEVWSSEQAFSSIASTCGICGHEIKYTPRQPILLRVCNLEIWGDDGDDITMVCQDMHHEAHTLYASGREVKWSVSRESMKKICDDNNAMRKQAAIERNREHTHTVTKKCNGYSRR